MSSQPTGRPGLKTETTAQRGRSHSPPRWTPSPNVPQWLRTDWSETSFDIPDFAGDYFPGPQFEWAAKNATVAIHDAFVAGSWAGISDRRKAIYYAICDVVLQRWVSRGLAVD